LTQLIGKDVPFNFNAAYWEAFNKLYIAFTSALILRHYYPKLKTIVETNAISPIELNY
jgi:hypothetical protein